MMRRMHLTSKNAEFADTTVIVKFKAEGAAEVGVQLLPQGSDYLKLKLQIEGSATTLASFPGHRVFLGKCPYFMAQVMLLYRPSTTNGLIDC